MINGIFFFLDGPLTVASGGTTSDVSISGSTYRVHTFSTVGSSSFVVQGEAIQSLEVLVVGGGGGAGTYGGGGNFSGGGGGGGVLTGSLSNVTAGTYSVTVGAAGSGQANGGDSVFSTYTAFGGGYGGVTYSGSGASGGSGGGAGGYTNPSGCCPSVGSGGAKTQTTQGTLTGYGQAGYVPPGYDSYGSGDGGGANGSGGPLSLSITGTSENYGGGGAGAWNTNRRPGEAVHYGKGGSAGGTGAGQGIVIVRYKIS